MDISYKVLTRLVDVVGALQMCRWQ